MKDEGRAFTAAAASPVARLYDAALAPERRPALIEYVAARCGAHGGWVFDIAHRGDFECRVSAASTVWGASEKLRDTWAAEHAHHGATHLRTVARGRPGTVHVEGAFADDPERIGRRPDVRFLHERLDVFERCAVRLGDDPARPDCLALYYRASRAGIRSAECTVLLSLWPHVAQSVALGRTFDALRARFDAALTVLDRVDAGLALLGSDARVVSANAAARGILERRAEIGVDEAGRLACRDPADDARLRRAVRDVAATVRAGGGPARVRLALGGRAVSPCLLELSPLVDSADELGARFRGVLLSLVDTGDPPDIDAGTLGEAYGLTEAETEVAALTLRGRTNEEIAEVRGVSADTVKSQVASTLRKCGARNRVELVRRAAMLRAPLRD